MFKHVLVVCTGNICRSPMAEAMLQAAAPGRIVESAGIGAMVGWPATAEAQQVMKGRGLDISGHAARQLTSKMLSSSDLVLCMDATHAAWIHRRHPQYRGKVHKLLKWRGNLDIDDPYGHPREFFERIYEELHAGVNDWVSRL